MDGSRPQRCVFLVVLAGLTPIGPSDLYAQRPPAAPDLRPNSTARFRLTFDPLILPSAYTGRVYVILSTRERPEPRKLINNWHVPSYLFAQDVTEVSPGGSVLVGGKALFSPVALSALPAGNYWIQAVVRRSLDHYVPGTGLGDLYSDSTSVTWPAGKEAALELRLNHVVKEESFKETNRVKLVEFVSPSLSKFHHRPIKIRAGVRLPPYWRTDGTDRYPVLYVIPGYGSNHRMAYALGGRILPPNSDPNILMVVPDPGCDRGHCVFADSDTNGPWGRALVDELIPRVEARFRGAASGEHRYVVGVSSGGWSALWLQVTYPDKFNGCWAHCPDPVDFRDFQQINLYQPGSNMFFDGAGNRRPLARRNGKVVIEYEDFVRREEVLGPGGQIRSFESVFSRRRPDGTPEPLFDVETGSVNTQVARSWERFDIRLILERNWATLGKKLAGKLHIYGGEQDTFYLEGAVGLLKESLEKLGSDAEVVIVPRMDHRLYRRAAEPMLQTILSAEPPLAGSGVSPTSRGRE